MIRFPITLSSEGAICVSERLKGASAGRFKRGQFDTKGHGNLDGRFLQNLSSELRCGASTENGKKQGIEQLFASGMPKRKIARTLGIDRKSVDRHLRALKSKGATPEEALTTEVLTGSESSKGANALTGSETLENILGHSQTSPRKRLQREVSVQHFMI